MQEEVPGVGGSLRAAQSRVRGGRKQEPRNRVMGQPMWGTETPSVCLQMMGE